MLVHFVDGDSKRTRELHLGRSPGNGIAGVDERNGLPAVHEISDVRDSEDRRIVNHMCHLESGCDLLPLRLSLFLQLLLPSLHGK